MFGLCHPSLSLLLNQTKSFHPELCKSNTRVSVREFSTVVLSCILLLLGKVTAHVSVVNEMHRGCFALALFLLMRASKSEGTTPAKRLS